MTGKLWLVVKEKVWIFTVRIPKEWRRYCLSVHTRGGGGGCYPIQPDWGLPHPAWYGRGVPHIRTGGGRVFLIRMEGGIPALAWMGYPLVRPDGGSPPPPPPAGQAGWGVPPLCQDGWGTPPIGLDGIHPPPHHAGWGTSPPQSGRQSNIRSTCYSAGVNLQICITRSFLFASPSSFGRKI